MRLIIIVAANHFKTDITHEFPVTFKYDVHIETWRPMSLCTAVQFQQASSRLFLFKLRVLFKTWNIIVGTYIYLKNYYLLLPVLFLSIHTNSRYQSSGLYIHHKRRYTESLKWDPKPQRWISGYQEQKTNKGNPKTIKKKEKTNKKKKAKHLVKENTFSAES